MSRSRRIKLQVFRATIFILLGAFFLVPIGAMFEFSTRGNSVTSPRTMEAWTNIFQAPDLTKAITVSLELAVITSVGMLVLLLAVQGILTRLSDRLRLKPHELFTIYVMMLLASMVSSRGLLQKLIPLLVVPNYNATAENGWPVRSRRSLCALLWPREEVAKSGSLVERT